MLFALLASICSATKEEIPSVSLAAPTTSLEKESLTYMTTSHALSCAPFRPVVVKNPVLIYNLKTAWTTRTAIILVK
jgi:hypothetical protein